MNPKVNKILVANRGEIAVRIIHACREMGIPAVAVYSEADRDALHVQLADEAVCIGPPAPLESYLNMDALTAAARAAGVDAVHPGYGFLAESPAFAERCLAEGLTFIGPPPEAVRAMGNKVEARRLMERAGVPVVPGTEGTTGEAAALLEAARKIAPPLFVKAAAGGGGKGMRRVDRMEELEATLEAAAREAKSAFGDGTVYIEKYLERPRHIEFQVLADLEGRTIHLFERECSIQRRNQKIVEETPSTALTPELRREMGEAAVAAARAVGYVGAGTVEFLFDDREGTYYFLEMNTRIQVEHPITEMVTGEDLVKWQLRLAAGEPLTLKQREIEQRGHAIECRINAEDPESDFRPSPGRIEAFVAPGGCGVRWDSHIYQGYVVPPTYDSLLGKLIVHRHTRPEAISTMRRALEEFVIFPTKTTIGLCREIMTHQAFNEGRCTTAFIEREILGG